MQFRRPCRSLPMPTSGRETDAGRDFSFWPSVRITFAKIDGNVSTKCRGLLEVVRSSERHLCRIMLSRDSPPQERRPPDYFQNCLLAILAPSAIAENLANTTSGSTAAWPTQVPKPQSEPATTLSRPTSLA